MNEREDKTSMRAFERQPSESQKAYNAFQKYLALGPERTLAAAADEVYGRYKKGTRRQAPGKIKEWAKRFDWHARAQAWDDVLAMARLEGIEEEQRRKARDHAERELALDERFLAFKEKVLPKMEQMADFPLATQKVKREEKDEQGTVVYQEVHVHPAKWSWTTLASLMEVFDKTPDRLDVGGEVEPVRFTLWLGEHEPHVDGSNESTS